MPLMLDTPHVNCISSCLYLKCVEGNNQGMSCHLNCSSHLWLDFCFFLFLHLVSEPSLINLNYLSQFN